MLRATPRATPNGDLIGNGKKIRRALSRRMERSPSVQIAPLKRKTEMRNCSGSEVFNCSHDRALLTRDVSLSATIVQSFAFPRDCYTRNENHTRIATTRHVENEKENEERRLVRALRNLPRSRALEISRDARLRDYASRAHAPSASAVLIAARLYAFSRAPPSLSSRNVRLIERPGPQWRPV